MRSSGRNAVICFTIALIVIASSVFCPPLVVAQGSWPMPGHDAQRSGRGNFAGPTAAPMAPAWTFSTSSPIVGDIVTSAEGHIYFASDKLYALNPDGTSFVPPITIGTASTGPLVDDSSGLIYVAVAALDGGFDLLSFTKQLQGEAVVLHVPKPLNGAIISPLVLGHGGVIYFLAGRFPGVVYAAGAVQWSNPVCPSESGPSTPFGISANGPALSNDGTSIFVMCSATVSAPGGLFRLDALTGNEIAAASSDRNSTEPALDSLQHVRSGWQAFGGAVFCGDYLTWDFSLTLLTPPSAFCDSSLFTTSRAAILPDGRSTVRIGFSFPPNNQLDAEGANNWIVSADGSAVPNFSSLPSIDAAGNVFIGNTQGIEALSAIDGHTLWSFTTGDTITTQPVVANGGALYVGSSSGKVYAFNTAPAAQNGTVYVSGSGAGFATVDLRSASVVANNNSFTGGGVIQVSPDGARSYVSAIMGLAVVNNATNQVLTTVPVGSRPEWIALAPDGSHIYVSQPNISSVPGIIQGIYVVDAATNAVVATIPISGPQRIAVAPDNSRVYVGSAGRGIAVVNPASNSITDFINIPGSNVTGLAFTPDSTHAYAGDLSGSIYFIDARSDVLIQTLPLTGALGGGVGDVTSSPDGKKIYAANVRTSPVDPARNVFVLDTTTNSVSGQIPVSFPASEMAISSDGANLMVGDSDIGELVVASTATDSVIETIRVNDPCCPIIIGIGTQPPATTIVPRVGTIVVTTNNVAASFSIVGGGLSFAGAGLTFSQSVPPGTYTINFAPIPGFITPASQTASVVAGATTNIEAVYQPIPVLSASPNSVSISYQTGAGIAVAPAELVVSSSSQNVAVTLAINDPNNHTWLAIAPVSGQTPLHIIVSVAPGLPSGVYSAFITAKAVGFSDLLIPVNLTVSAGGNARLLFPIKTDPARCHGTCTPFTANISAVYDHAMTKAYEANAFEPKKNAPCVPLTQPPSGWGRIVDFLGEVATEPDSSTFATGVCDTLHGYQGAEGTPFLQNTNYMGNPSTTLFYDAHPGYDYPFPYPTPTDSLSKLTAVYPAVSGCVTYRLNAAGAAAADYHVMAIVPMEAQPAGGQCPTNPTSETGYVVFYLHLSSYLDEQGDPVACLVPNPGHKECKKQVKCATCAREGQWVSTSTTEPLAYVGSFAGGVWSGVHPHLHFEVDKVSGATRTPLDPYGWWLATPDPFSGASNTWLWVEAKP